MNENWIDDLRAGGRILEILKNFIWLIKILVFKPSDFKFYIILGIKHIWTKELWGVGEEGEVKIQNYTWVSKCTFLAVLFVGGRRYARKTQNCQKFPCGMSKCRFLGRLFSSPVVLTLKLSSKILSSEF